MVRKIKKKRDKPPSKQELDAKVRAALGVMTQEEADAIIGEPEAEYTLLDKAVTPLHHIWLRLAYNHGLQKSDTVLNGLAKHLVLVATLIHYAYALGIRRGRRESANEAG